MDSFTQQFQSLPPQMQQQIMQKMMEKQATEQAGFPFWQKQQDIQHANRMEEEDVKDEYTKAREFLQENLKERGQQRAIQESPAFQAFTDYQDQQRAHTDQLVRGLQSSGEIFKMLPKSPKFLSELSDDHQLSPEEADALKGVKSLIDKRLKEIDGYEKDPKYADMLWETTNKGNRKLTDMGKYIVPTINKEKDYLDSISGALKGVDKWNPTIKRGDYFRAVNDGLQYYNSVQNNPLVQDHPEVQSRGSGVSSPAQLGDTVKYIDDYVKSHSDWVFVPEINMLIPGKRYEELKNMSGYILDGKKLTTTPGTKGPAWDFLEHLPEGKKKEFAQAISGSKPVQNPQVAQEAAIQNLMIGLKLRPDMQKQIFQALPIYAGQNGLDLGKVIAGAKNKMNFSATVVDSHARKSSVPSPVEQQPDNENRMTIEELQKLSGQQKKSYPQPGSFGHYVEDVKDIAGTGAIATAGGYGAKKLAWPAVRALGKGFMKLPGWGKAAGIATLTLPALYEMYEAHKNKNKKPQNYQNQPGE